MFKPMQLDPKMRGIPTLSRAQGRVQSGGGGTFVFS